MRRTTLLIIIFLAITKLSFAQKTYFTKGRVLAQDLSQLEGVTITDKNNAEKTTTDKRGLFQIVTQKNDTLIFTYNNYPQEIRVIFKPSDNLNVILLDNKNGLHKDYTQTEYRAYKKLYNILDKDARKEGLWIY
jgi:hypothetical protein